MESILRFIPEDVRSQGPDPLAFPDLVETWVVVVYFIYLHDGLVSKSVSFTITVFRHRRFLCFPMRDVEMMAIDPVV